LESAKQKGIGFWSAVAIGVGGMVGGGIFAVLGLAVELARGGTPVAFLVAGVVALLTSYSYAKLAVAFPSEGGTVVLLDRAFGVDLFTGTMNNLLWLSYVVMLSLYAFAFGSYGATFFGASHHELVKHLLVSAAIVVPMALNMLSAGVVGRAETAIVAVKIAILLFFAGVGLHGVQTERLAPGTWASPIHLLSGGMLIFLAYEGFELIANTAEDVQDVQKTLPRALYTCVVFVIILYVLVAWVSVGSLPVEKIVSAKDYALAEAARPFLGQTGFTLIAAAALLSTFSAINATLYGSARLSYAIAKEGELPAALEDKVWNEPIEGLVITSVLALLFANLGDLSSISMMGSAGFLLIFGAVNAAQVRLSKKTGGRRSIAIIGVAACIAALVALVEQTLSTHPSHVFVLAGMIGISLGVELIYREFRGHEFHLGRRHRAR
jgi:amino acid transporter